jgi:hypothetical protein
MISHEDAKSAKVWMSGLYKKPKTEEFSVDGFVIKLYFRVLGRLRVTTLSKVLADFDFGQFRQHAVCVCPAHRGGVGLPEQIAESAAQ